MDRVLATILGHEFVLMMNKEWGYCWLMEKLMKSFVCTGMEIAISASTKAVTAGFLNTVLQSLRTISI